eukprot:9428051-Prorocentrum_lima.AAC.1
MTSSLVGSEMCIRDSLERDLERLRAEMERMVAHNRAVERQRERGEFTSCLLYTSDAADDM